MIYKVTITEGTGNIRCPYPAFELDEIKRKSIFIMEMSEQLKTMENDGLISIDLISEAEYRKALAVRSVQLSAKAIADKKTRLKRLIKSGGAEKILTGSGLTMTVEDGDATPEEIAKEAQQELDAMDQQQEQMAADTDYGEFMKDVSAE